MTDTLVTNAIDQKPSRSLPTVLHQISEIPRKVEDGTIRYDGLLDIFPESYWSRFTQLHSVTLHCRLSGPARLRLIRRQVDGSRLETLVCEMVCNEAEVRLSTLLAPAAAPESSLLLEIIPQRGGSAQPLLSAAWEATQAVNRRPRVGLAITTFNRESFLVANLTRLHGRLAGGRAVIVNHGLPGLEGRLRNQLPKDSAIRWIDQENSGGAGGFTRGMMEHRAAGDITHVLLMDDDIDLPGDLVERVTAILSYTQPEVCLGGAMFDYHRRDHLFSAGDMLLPRSFGIGHVTPPGGCVISRPEGVDFLARVHRPDFNGWWCFAFPLEALEQVGLPMPCFIRGDDVEFGYRLKRAGMPTLVWPGLVVWHMPFPDKSAPWHMFYDRRNSLFANARHRRVGRLAAIGKLVAGFTHHLLRYDYDRVRAMTMGVAAFNMGAARMAQWNHRDHASMIAATSTMQIANDDAAQALLAVAQLLEPKRTSGFSRSILMAGRMVLDLTGLPIGKPTAYRLTPGAVWCPDFTRRPALVIESDSQGRARYIYRRDPSQSRQATLRCIKALLGMVLHFHQRVPAYFPPSC